QLTGGRIVVEGAETLLELPHRLEELPLPLAAEDRLRKINDIAQLLHVLSELVKSLDVEAGKLPSPLRHLAVAGVEHHGRKLRHLRVGIALRLPPRPGLDELAKVENEPCGLRAGQHRANLVANLLAPLPERGNETCLQLLPEAPGAGAGNDLADQHVEIAKLADRIPDPARSLAGFGEGLAPQRIPEGEDGRPQPAQPHAELVHRLRVRAALDD